jgi:site-specific recombinase XerD
MNQRREIKFLTKDEVKKIINTCDNSLKGMRDRALLEALFSTGLRISEALNLKIEDFLAHDIKELTIIGKGGWQRIVFFSPEARKAIRTYLDFLQEYNLVELESEWLFDLTPRAVQIMVKKRAIRAGIKKRVSPHVFRHSLATDLLSRGVDIAFVSKFLGHRNIANTMIYSHIVDPQLKKIHEKLYK